MLTKKEILKALNPYLEKVRYERVDEIKKDLPQFTVEDLVGGVHIESKKVKNPAGYIPRKSPEKLLMEFYTNSDSDEYCVVTVNTYHEGERIKLSFLVEKINGELLLNYARNLRRS